MSDVLYVVCHGLISLFQNADGSFTALMIKMKDHRYLAGSWLNETNIRTGSLKLTGVSDDATGLPPEVLGSPSLDPAKNIILKVGQIPAASSADIETRIELPKPVAVHSFFTSSNVVLDDPKGVIQNGSRTVSGVQVLVYSIPQGAKPAIQPHAWSPTPRGIQPRVTVLHLFNEPDEELLKKQVTVLTAHNLDEFRQSAQVLGADVTLKQRTAGEPPKQTIVLPDLLAIELQPRSLRETTVTLITQNLVDAANAAAQTPAATVPISIPIGTDAANCNGCHGA